jgi:hypothetical protein
MVGSLNPITRDKAALDKNSACAARIVAFPNTKSGSGAVTGWVNMVRSILSVERIYHKRSIFVYFRPLKIINASWVRNKPAYRW